MIVIVEKAYNAIVSSKIQCYRESVAPSKWVQYVYLCNNIYEIVQLNNTIEFLVCGKFNFHLKYFQSVMTQILTHALQRRWVVVAWLYIMCLVCFCFSWPKNMSLWNMSYIIISQPQLLQQSPSGYFIIYQLFFSLPRTSILRTKWVEIFLE